MKQALARASAVAFPATSIVIIAVSELQRHGVEVSDLEATAAAGLLMWVALIAGFGWDAQNPKK